MTENERANTASSSSASAEQADSVNSPETVPSTPGVANEGNAANSPTKATNSSSWWQKHKEASHEEREKIQAQYRKWEKYTVWPMFILSLIFVALTALIISPPPHLPRSDWQKIMVIALALWALFILDFFVRFALSPDREHFLKTQAFELSTLLIPYLRPFLLIRYVWRLDYFRHRGASGLRQRAVIAVAMFAIFFVYASSTIVWVVERNAPHANIVHWSDAIWWGFVTISTVGYGDYYPVTGTGRFVAVGLMVGGLFTVGVTSAAIISAFNNSMRSYLKEYGEASAVSSAKRGHAIMEAISMGALQDDHAVQPEAGSSAEAASGGGNDASAGPPGDVQ